MPPPMMAMCIFLVDKGALVGVLGSFVVRFAGFFFSLDFGCFDAVIDAD